PHASTRSHAGRGGRACRGGCQCNAETRGRLVRDGTRLVFPSARSVPGCAPLGRSPCRSKRRSRETRLAPGEPRWWFSPLCVQGRKAEKKASLFGLVIQLSR